MSHQNRLVIIAVPLLFQTAKWFPSEPGQKGLPAQALVEAKNEIIALHNTGRLKDQEIAGLRQTVQNRELSLGSLLQQYNLMKQQMEDLVIDNQVGVICL